MPRKTTRTNVPTATLRQAFLEMLRRNDRPAERIGETEETYKLPDGKTFRLRTNNMPALLSKVANGTVEARLPFESEDYVGVAYTAAAIGHPSIIVCYLVPSDVAAKAMRANHREWLKDKSHSRNNESRLIRFDGDPRQSGRGFQEHWYRYLIGETTPDVLPHDGDANIDSTKLSRKIETCKQELAALAGVLPSAVSISISY